MARLYSARSNAVRPRSNASRGDVESDGDDPALARLR